MHTDPFPFPALTVDIVTFTLQAECLQVMLIQRNEEPFKGRWALPGGCVQLNESLQAAAQRVLCEATGIDEAYLEQLYTYGDPGRDPRGRVVTVAYFALIPADAMLRAARSPDSMCATHRACWCPASELPILAFDHVEITRYALNRLRYKLEYSAVGFELLPAEFTLTEIQKTYELILGEKLDKRNFRRRILEAGVIEPTPYMRSGEGRPARTYCYRADAVAEVKARRLFP